MFIVCHFILFHVIIIIIILKMLHILYLNFMDSNNGVQGWLKATGQVITRSLQSVAEIDWTESGGALEWYFNWMFYRCALARMFWLSKLDLKRLNKTQGSMSSTDRPRNTACLHSYET